MVEPNGAPRAVRWAAAVAGVQAVAILAATVVLAVATLLGDPDSFGRAAVAVLIGLAAGLGLLRAAQAIHRPEGWARAPVIVCQLLLIPVGYTLAVQAELPAYGVPILASCAAELYLLLTPESRAAFRRL